MIQRIINNFYLRNLTAWFLYVSPDLFQDLSDIQKTGWAYLFRDVSGHTCFFIYFVFHSRVLYEHLFARKQYVLYAASVLVSIFIWREGTSYLIWLATKPATEHIYHIAELRDHNWLYWVFIYWADVVYILIALGVYLAFTYFKERTALLEMDNMRKELELKQLNEQLNPHFLFNALNNIYSHLLRDSGDGKELILKLSELMRYILDSSKKNMVSLNDEIKFIDNYVAFEKERLGKRVEIKYDKHLPSTDFKIVPLILFNFIENAFKHGTTSIQKSEITIRINANSDSLHMEVTNPIRDSAIVSTQIGLNNAQRRLSLLYPGTNMLTIAQENSRYTATLELKNIRA